MSKVYLVYIDMGYDGTSIIGIATNHHEACKLIVGDHCAMNLIKDVYIAEHELNKPVGCQLSNEPTGNALEVLKEWEGALSK